MVERVLAQRFFRLDQIFFSVYIILYICWYIPLLSSGSLVTCTKSQKWGEIIICLQQTIPKCVLCPIANWNLFHTFGIYILDHDSRNRYLQKLFQIYWWLYLLSIFCNYLYILAFITQKRRKSMKITCESLNQATISCSPRIWCFPICFYDLHVNVRGIT